LICNSFKGSDRSNRWYHRARHHPVHHLVHHLRRLHQEEKESREEIVCHGKNIFIFNETV